jgi:hypothetical protein
MNKAKGFKEVGDAIAPIPQLRSDERLRKQTSNKTFDYGF